VSRAGAIAGAVLVLGLNGCAGVFQPACPAGQSHVRTAQLFLGASKVKLADADLRRFVAQEVTPRFPDGVTVLDGGGQWKGRENRMMREAAKVLLIVLPPRSDAEARVEAVRAAYRSRFKQETILVLPPPTCVAL
jgi:hypothetical protein